MEKVCFCAQCKKIIHYGEPFVRQWYGTTIFCSEDCFLKIRGARVYVRSEKDAGEYFRRWMSAAIDEGAARIIAANTYRLPSDPFMAPKNVDAFRFDGVENG